MNGVSFYYEIMGEGEPLVLVHAGIADGRMWDGQFEAFAGRYRVVRYDMRGYGRTVAPSGGSGLLDGRKNGHRLRARVPGTNPCPGAGRPAVGGFEPAGDPPEEWDELVAADEAGDLERVSELEVRVWVDGPYRGTDSVEPAVRDLVREMDLIALKNEAAGSGDEQPLEPPAVNRLIEVQVPALVIVGDQDRPEIAATADLLEERLPNAQKVVMCGSAHLPKFLNGVAA